MTAAAAALAPIHLTAAVEVNGHVIYRLQDRQVECFYRTPLYAREEGFEHIGYGGAAGSAKSHTARAIAMAVAATWWGSTTIIFRKTEAEVLENHAQKYKLELPERLPGEQSRFYLWNGDNRSFTFPGLYNSRILLGFLRYDDDVFKYIGNEYDVMIFEEATQQTEFQMEYLTGNRLRATVDPSIPFALYPSNPGGPGHQYFKRHFVTRDFREDEDPDKYTFIQARLIDNQVLVRRDPGYKRRLDRLPEPYRSWQRDGDFEAGAGAALPQLRRAIHLIDAFPVPDYWERFGAFDWGYDHLWVFGEYAVNEDGDVFKLRTVTGHHEMPATIAERIKTACGGSIAHLRYITSGRDLFHERRARGENSRGQNTPTLHEQFMEVDKGFRIMREANTERVLGLQNLRAYLQWDNTGPLIDGLPSAGDPGLRFFRNLGNIECLQQLENMVPDPDNAEDVLKVDANTFGEGGDDRYDETRYAVASRPKRAVSVEQRKPIKAFAPEILKLEMDRGRKGDDKREKMPTKRNQAPLHPEMGDYA